LMKVVVSTFTSKIDRAGPQEIANVCWALATARAARPSASLPLEFAEAFEIMGTSASSRLDTFAVQELCSMSWAFGRIGYPHKRMLTALAALLAKHEGLPFTFHAQGLANILWAMAKMSAIMTDMADLALAKEVALALLPACVRMVPRLKALELTSVIWSCAKLGICSGMVPEADQIFYQTSKMVSEVLTIFSAQGLTNTLYAFTKFQSNSPILLYHEFLDILAVVITTRLQEFKAFSFLYLLESIHQLGQHVETIPSMLTLADAIAMKALQSIHNFSSNVLGRMAYLTADIQTESCQLLGSCLAWHVARVNRKSVQPVEDMHIVLKTAGPDPVLVPSPVWMEGQKSLPDEGGGIMQSSFCDIRAELCSGH